MFKIKFVLTVIFSISICFNTNAQDWILNGLVTAFDSIPLKGVNIHVKSTKA